MAQRILEAGHHLAVYARRPEQARPLIMRGAIAADSLGALAAHSEVLGVCVGTDDQVQQVADVVLPHMTAGSVLAVHSTVAPQLCVRLAAAAPHGVEVLDAPVSGGRARAFDGELTVMVGGPELPVQQSLPVFETFGSPVLHVGPLGSGQVLKLVNNYLFAAQVAVTEQAIVLCRELGLDVALSMTAIASSTGSSRANQMFVAGGCRSAFPRHSEGTTHGARLLAKDIALMDGLLADRKPPALLDSAARAGLAVAFEAGAADDRG
ncbi:NAD-binding protein [Mycolicibacterium chitae]|uniref:Beta-hydroxyacid dehydrogenase n=2 Tax=Mycolicibacterium chitae TaxID=1792 RepID=A0A3S4SBB9_MYCCI|nr:NAD(P)-binding domain-containing protein [Mycolicibacterium chitae]MCV7105070.1 NAD-binding protein [Mycolicibacterium chitae]VEG49261.1 beta-hydroxyacid dehydrogenase [Mycolicibacterium chitae]